MNWTQIYQDTFIPELPKIWNANFEAIKRYLDIFYDENQRIIIRPVNSTGLIKGAKGEFVTAIIDNLIVKRQFTNLYSNITTADSDFVTVYNGVDASTRIADPSTLENQDFAYIDVNKPYYKISNDSSIAFLSDNLGQQFQLIFDPSTIAPFNILLDPSYNGSYKTLQVTAADSSATWITLIAIEYDASWGTTWVIKQYGGTYSII